jgi:AraC family transcriptional regulator
MYFLCEEIQRVFNPENIDQKEKKMKKVFILVVGFLLVTSLYPEDQVNIKEHISFWYVFLEVKGSRLETLEKIQIFLQEIQKQELQSKISGSLFCVLFDSTLQVEGIRDVWALGYKVSEDTVARPPLKKAEYHYKKVATMIYKGPYDTVGQAYNIILPFIEENNFEVIGPPVERWLDDPNQVELDECRTEIIIPIRQKGVQIS